jgi:hypothetical protein
MPGRPAGHDPPRCLGLQAWGLPTVQRCPRARTPTAGTVNHSYGNACAVGTASGCSRAAVGLQPRTDRSALLCCRFGQGSDRPSPRNRGTMCRCRWNTDWVASGHADVMMLQGGVANSHARCIVRADTSGHSLRSRTWICGTTRVWPGVTGRRGLNAIVSSQRATTAAGASPATIWQNTHVVVCAPLTARFSSSPSRSPDTAAVAGAAHCSSGHCLLGSTSLLHVVVRRLELIRPPLCTDRANR